MGQPFGTKVTKTGGAIVAGGIALILLISLLKDFNLVDFTASTGAILTIVAVFYIFSEMSIRFALGQMNAVRLVVLLVGVLALVSAVASLFGLTVGFLAVIAGLVKAVLAILFIWATFT